MPATGNRLRTDQSEGTADARQRAGWHECGTEPLQFRLELQSTAILLTVLANVARLGCSIHQIRAAGTRAHLSVVPPAQVLAHRVESCLGQIVGVLSIKAVG